SADGKMLWSGHADGAVKSWDVDRPGPPRTQKVGEGPVTLLRPSPDGKLLALRLGDDRGRLRLWDAAAGQEHVAPGQPPAVVQHLAFAPDGKTLAAAGAGERIVLWDPATGKRRIDLDGGLDGLIALAFAPKGKVLLAAGRAGEGWAVRLWNADPESAD